MSYMSRLAGDIVDELHDLFETDEFDVEFYKSSEEQMKNTCKEKE